MRQKAFLIISLFLAIFLSVSYAADQPNFPLIYVDAGCAGTKVGSLANPYDDLSDINWSTGGDNSIFDYLAGSPSQSPTIYLMEGDTWREQMIVGCSGTVTYPIIITSYGSGANPLVLGSAELIGIGGDWTDEGGDVWSRAATTEVKHAVFDTTHTGTEDATPDAQYDWDWVANELFVYATENPTTYYTSIEAGQRDFCLASTRDYIIFDGIDTRYSNRRDVYMEGISPQCKNSTHTYAGEEGIYLWHPTGTFLVDNCTVEYCYQMGIRVDTAAAGTISNCTVNACTQDDGSGHNISFEDSSYVTIEDCTIHGCTGQAQIGGDGNDHCIIQRNVIYDGEDQGVDLSSPTTCTYNIVRYNIIYGHTTSTWDGGVHIWASDDAGRESSYNEVYYNIIYGNKLGIYVGGKCYHNKIYNNVLYNNEKGIALVYEATQAEDPENCTFYNNIIYSSSDTHFYIDSTEATNLSDNNCFYPDDTNCFWYDSSYYHTLATFQAAWGKDASSINSDPKFIDASNDDFRINPHSPCIDKGTDVSLVVDYEGKRVRHAPDIGAYECQANALFLSAFPNPLLLMLMAVFALIAYRRRN